MIFVSKEQAEYIRKQSPTSHITIVNVQAKAKKKKRAVEETDVTKRLIKEFNAKQTIIESYPKNKI